MRRCIGANNMAGLALYIAERYMAPVKTVAYTTAARRQLRGLTAQVQARIKAKLAAYANGESADVTALQGEPGARLRVGDYRLVFVETETGIEVRAVGHRREIYR
jgi:mRNA interferase RelE/StbE